MDDLDLGATIKGFSPGQKVFGRYTLKKILGRGGMGVVWLARDEELGRDTALKFLPEMVAADRVAIDEMKREVRRAIDLAHPHIVKIHDFVSDGRTAAVSMEYVVGDTLAALRLDEPARVIPVEKLGPWVRQLCNALDYAHGKMKVVHRDLKPANLMIDREGDLKVLDFGIAASLSESVSRVSKQAGSSGTPLYMSPQQMIGENPSVTDDVYSVGATLYELLSTKPPFFSGSIFDQVRVKVPALLNERRKDADVEGVPVPAAWEQTIAACLAKEPAGRPQSAGEVAERLGLAAGSATKNTTVGAVAPNRPSVERLAAPAEASREGRNPMTLPGTQASALGATRSTKMPLIAGIVAGVILLAGAGWYFGIHAPEQARLEAEQKQQAAEQARLAEIKRLDNERQLAEAERLAAARGSLVIRTNPAGAEVRVGAIALEKSPLTLKDQKLGKYPVRVRAEGYEDWSGEIEVKENEFADLDIALIRSTGTLSLSTDPAGLEAELSGRNATAELPLAPKQTVRTPAELKLPTGTYDVTFRRAGWADQTKSVNIARAGTAQASATFDPGSMTAVAKVAAFFSKLKADPAVRELPSGLHYKITWEGTGAKPSATSKVKLHYKGYFIDGTVFDSTLDRGEPAEFTAQGTIQGFGEGLQQIGNGGKITLYIPPALGYGDTGTVGIPGGAVLIFEVELLEVDGKTPLKFNVPGASGRITAEPAANPTPEIEKLRVAADAGDALAMTNLGVAYATGAGVVKNQAVANEWYLKAADKGEPTAMKNLGACYANGLGVAKDLDLANEWYRKAAEKGQAEAMTNLGYAYETGAGVAKDQAVAIEWYRKAAGRGEPVAMRNLGVVYGIGQGVAKDPVVADDWYRKAARAGNSAAQEELKKRNLTW